MQVCGGRRRNSCCGALSLQPLCHAPVSRLLQLMMVPRVGSAAAPLKSWQLDKRSTFTWVYVCVRVCRQLYATIRKCVSIILKKRNTHILVFSWLASLSLSSNEGVESKRTGKWTNQKRQRYLNCFFLFSYLFVLYKRSDVDVNVNANVEGGVA